MIVNLVETMKNYLAVLRGEKVDSETIDSMMKKQANAIKKELVESGLTGPISDFLANYILESVLSQDNTIASINSLITTILSQPIAVETRDFAILLKDSDIEIRDKILSIPAFSEFKEDILKEITALASPYEKFLVTIYGRKFTIWSTITEEEGYKSDSIDTTGSIQELSGSETE